MMTIEELAAETGRPVEEIEAMIAEAEADAITKESMDPSTFCFHNWGPEAEERARELLKAAGHQA